MSSEAVISTVLMLVGQNSRIVATSAAEKLNQINKSLLPDVFAESQRNTVHHPASDHRTVDEADAARGAR